MKYYIATESKSGTIDFLRDVEGRPITWDERDHALRCVDKLRIKRAFVICFDNVQITAVQNEG